MSKTRSHTDKKNMKTASWFAAAIFLLGLAVLGGLYMEQNTTITAIEFQGNHFSTEDELTGAFKSPIGMLADSVDFRSLTDPLKTLPYVEDVSMEMGFRGQLTMNIRERQPIGLIIDGGKSVYIDKDGIRLPDRLQKSVDVPLVYGFAAEPIADTLNSDNFIQVRDFLVSAKQNSFGWLTISEVAWNDREGVVALSHENGVKLIFGHDDFENKFSHWEAFYAEVVSSKGINSFRTVDLRFRDQIVAEEI
ncbi:MAG: cell division protein FtsQ/DivIB [Balneolaceae bacterium]